MEDDRRFKATRRGYFKQVIQCSQYSTNCQTVEQIQVIQCSQYFTNCQTVEQIEAIKILVSSESSKLNHSVINKKLSLFTYYLPTASDF